MENRSGPRDTRNLSRNIERLELTEEERKVLKECRMNSMIRGVPAGMISALITKFAISTGKFPHLAYWSRFYYAVTFTGGLLFGIASYRKTCLEEIMKLENSVLADQVREFYKKSGMEYNLPKQQKRDAAFDDSPTTGSDYNLEDESSSREESVPHSTRLTDDENKFHGSNDWQDDKHDDTKDTSFEGRRKQNRQLWQQDQYPARFGKTLPHRGTVKENKSNEQDNHQDSNIPISDDKHTQGSTETIQRNKYGDPIE